MNRQLIWKEWRDQRTPLLALWGLTPLFILAIAWYQGGLLLDMRDAPLTLGFLASFACLFVIGLSMFSGEWVRGHGSFLSRCPAGLSRAFGIKFGFLVAALLASGIIAWLSCKGLGVALGLNGSGQWIKWDSMLAIGLFTFMACVIAIASWGMQPGFALLGGPLVGGLLTWPLWWHALANSSSHISASTYKRNVQDFPWDPFGTALRNPSDLLWPCAIAGAVFSIWLAFQRRKSSRTNLAPWLPMAAALVGVIPAWVSWGIDRWDETNCIPGTDHFSVESALVGSDGNFAFLNVVSRFEHGKDVRGVPLKVDLATGEWEAIGSMGSFWTSQFEGEASRQWSTRTGMAHSVTLSGADGRLNGNHWDTNSGDLVDSPVLRTRSIVKPDPGDLGLPRGARLHSRRGLGFSITGMPTGSPRRIYDSVRERIYPATLDPKYSSPIVTTGGWLVNESVRIDESSFKRGPWQLYDPDDQSFSPVTSLEPNEIMRVVLRDGRIVGTSSFELYIYDSLKDQRTTIQSLGIPHYNLEYMRTIKSRISGGPTMASESLGLLATTSHKRYVGMVDLNSYSVKWVELDLGGNGFIVGVTGADQLIAVQENKHLIQLDLNSCESRLLFPQTEDQE